MVHATGRYWDWNAYGSTPAKATGQNGQVQIVDGATGWLAAMPVLVVDDWRESEAYSSLVCERNK
jgi:hypothetical protein